MPLNFWYLWQGQLVSALGAQAFQVMALYWLAQSTGSAGAGAAYMALSLLPPVALGPWLARHAQAWRPKRVLVVCDTLSALCALPFALAVALGLSNAWSVTLLLVASAGLASVNALLLPTMHASVPRLAPEQGLQRANSWMVTTQQLASVVGQGLGGVLYALTGPILLCLGHVLAYALSAALNTRIRYPEVRTISPNTAGAKESAWSLLRSSPELRRLALVSAGFNLLYALWLVLLPFQLGATQGEGAVVFGLALATYASGSLVGVFVLRRLTHYLGSSLLWYALVGQAFALTALGTLTALGAIFVTLFVLGLGIGVINVLVLTRVQLCVEDTWRASAVAVLRSGVHMATPLGFGVVALTQYAGNIPPSTVYLACGGLLLAFLMGVAAYHRSTSL